MSQRQDALLLGPPGTGKSHLAQAIGTAAAHQGFHVLYREAHVLLEELADATLDQRRRNYMKDVAALCRRVVVINHGQIVYDGSLSGIIDRFSSHKVLTLQFDDGQMPRDFTRYGEVIEVAEPRVKLRVDRGQISKVLAAVLANHALDDVSVEDPPLEEVIAQVFAQSAEDVGLPRGGPER